MADIATLGIAVERQQADAATQSLNRLTDAAVKAESASQRLTRGMNAAGASARAVAESGRSWREGLARLAQQQEAAAASAAKMGQVAQQAAAHTGRLENAITNLGLGLAGLRGPLGNVTDKLGGFLIGGGITAGAAIGIGAVIGAMKQLEDQSENTAEKVFKALDAIVKLRDTDKNIAQRRVAELKALQTSLQGELVSPGGPYGTGLGERAREAVNRFQAGLRSTATVNKELVETNRELVKAEAALNAIKDAEEQAFGDIPKAPIIEWAEGVKAAIADLDFAIRDVLLNGERLGRNLGPLSGGTGDSGNALVNAANAYSGFIRGTEGATGRGVRDTAKIAENWQSASQSVANIVTLLANADNATAQWLGTVVSLVGQLEDAATQIAKTGKLSTTSAIGIGAGVAGFLLGGLTEGVSADTKRYYENLAENNRQLERLSKSLNNAALGITGNQYGAAGRGISAILGYGGNIGKGIVGGVPGLNTSLVNQILTGQGTSLTELKDFAKSLGITLDTSNALRFVDSLKQLQKAMQETALVALRDFGGQLDLINRRWAIARTDNPLDKLADLLKLVSGEQGAPALGKYLGSLDLTSGADRNAARDYLLKQLDRAQSGQLTTAELGGLTVQQYLDFLSQFGDLLNQANEQIKQVVDNLRGFADSLKLDQGLTTLSPAQQLAEARRQYEDVLRAAQQGDQAAAGRLPEVARRFLEASRGYNASGSAYAADFARVLADTEAVAKAVEAGTTKGWEVLQEPIGQIGNNTASTVQELQVLVSVQVEANNKLIAALEEQRAETEALRTSLASALEGASL